MFQILHIFRKDGRRHWLEILISLFLLGYYVHSVLRPLAQNPMYLNTVRFGWIKEFAAPALVIFWFFLILRIVHGETLIGDRQWWVTKPYVWWKLLLAKCLFVFAVFSVPLFFSQLYLLYANGFPLLPNLWGILRLQLGLAFFLFLTAFLLASLTRNLVQAVLTVVVVIAGASIAIRLLAGSSSSTMSVGSLVPDYLQILFILLSCVGVLLWQFAFRKTWAARSALIASIAILALMARLPQKDGYIENEFPLASADHPPARIEANLHNPDSSSRSTKYYSEVLPTVFLQIPLKISGVAPQGVVLFRGLKLSLVAAGGETWAGEWQTAFAHAWTEDEFLSLSYGMPRKEFEKWENIPVKVHIELAVARYFETDPRELALSEVPFRDPRLGTCRINSSDFSALQCLRPFHATGFAATFDSMKFPCGDRSASSSETTVSHAWADVDSGDLIDVGLSPIADYSISFQKPQRGSPQRQFPGPRLCPGVKISLSEPKLAEKSRIQVEIPDVSVSAFSKGLNWLD
jgi:hypothetical protein